ncbi:hypothetical protein BSY19_4885 (plasmid) [Bosea sp. RAC05]|nr:hypothetical protein BSY19_4885 [Bosea sp. RAC05]
MKTRLLTLSLAFGLLSSTSVLAAVVEANSRIDKVSVHPDAAIVTRAAKVEVPAGSHQIVLRGLPPELDIASVRVEASGSGDLRILSVDDKPAPAPARPVVSRELAAKLSILKAKRAEYAAAADLIERRRAFIAKFAEAPLATLPDEQTDPLRWEERWVVLGNGLAKAAEDARAIGIRIEQTDAEIDALEATDVGRPPSIMPHHGGGNPLRDITIAVESPAAGSFDFRVSYKVGSARWSAAYDAKLVSATAKEAASLQLARRARISQATGEDWTDVALSVSTIQTQRRTSVPDVGTLVARVAEPPRPAPMPRPGMPTAPMQEFGGAGLADMRMSVAATEQQATVETAGYSVVFEVPGRVSIAGDASNRTILLKQTALTPAVSLQTAPSLDPAAYIEATFTAPDEAPLFPGPVTLTRDSQMIGQGQIPLTAPGAQVKLGFGIDDRIQVTYAPLSRKEEGPGIMGSTRSDTREFKATIRNLRQTPVAMTVVDRLPVSEQSNVEIERLSTMTPGSEPVSEEKRGVIAWKFDIPANGEKEVRTGYRLRWPADRQILLSRPR